MQANEFLIKAEAILARIRATLQEFEIQYNAFRELVKALECINYDKQINGAIDAENNLAIYWGSMEQSPEIRQQVLGETQRPSEGLVELQARLQREIGPMLRPENIIKQSHMPYILGKLVLQRKVEGKKKVLQELP
jgi:hypothetical protein